MSRHNLIFNNLTCRELPKAGNNFKKNILILKSSTDSVVMLKVVQEHSEQWFLASLDTSDPNFIILCFSKVQ